MAQEQTITIDAEDYGRLVVKRMLETGSRDAAIAAIHAMLAELGIVIVWQDDREAHPGIDSLPPQTLWDRGVSE